MEVGGVVVVGGRLEVGSTGLTTLVVGIGMVVVGLITAGETVLVVEVVDVVVVVDKVAVVVVEGRTVVEDAVSGTTTGMVVVDC